MRKKRDSNSHTDCSMNALAGRANTNYGLTLPVVPQIGIEPTKSLVSKTSRFSILRTGAFKAVSRERLELSPVQILSLLPLPIGLPGQIVLLSGLEPELKV